MKRVGIIESTNNEIKIIGFGILQGTDTVYDEDLGLDISVTKVLLDSGNEVLVKDAFIGDEDSILKEISNYKANGYKIL